MIENTCCFFGHRKIEITDKLKKFLYSTIENLILEKNVDTFLFGSKSQFDDVCYCIVSELKVLHPHIKRIYVRSQFPYINDDYKNYLLQSYEETYYPHHMLNAGKSAHIERNYEMIDKSNFCIVYFDENYIPPIQKKRELDFINSQPKSGTKIAYDYARKKQKTIINIFNG